MLSSLAVSLALAFWAPYSPTPVCPDGVQIHAAAFGHTTTLIGHRTDTGELVPHCEMWADPSIARLPVADQCAWIVRNIGWSFMGVPSSRDPRNVMYVRRWVVPRACR